MSGSFPELAALFRHSNRIVALTGAGVSTASGIPDYRSPGRPPHTPITHQTFVSRPEARQRYWARSMLGYATMAKAKPNLAHVSLAHGHRVGRLHAIVTQNVDGLHQRAAAAVGGQSAMPVCELHGSIHEVVCLSCTSVVSREALQGRLCSLNPQHHLHYLHHLHDAARPDGDVALAEAAYSSFVVPDCEVCGGVLKPHVTMFGDSLNPVTRALAERVLDEADGLLVAGTSLQVLSALRLVRAAHERGLPVGLVNRGPVREPHTIHVHVDAMLEPVLADLFDLPHQQRKQAHAAHAPLHMPAAAVLGADAP